MSILEKFFKNKKGPSEVPKEKPITPRIIHNEPVITHTKAILSDGKMYDTSKAKKLFETKEDELHGFFEAVYRVYFVTENGRYFSSKKTMSLRNSFDLLANTETKTMHIDYDDLRIESESVIKAIVGKTDIELYKQLFGEVEEA